jgi:ATP-dependent helicase/nuclease subunit B
MSRIRIVAPGEDLLAVIASELVPAGKDYTRNCVVFPGKRPAHFLRKRLAAIHGTAFLPPVLYSIDSFAEHIYRTAAGGTHRLCDEIDAIAVLHETHSAVRGMIGEDESQSFESFLPGARKLLGELEELLLADIAPDKLRATLKGFGFPRFVPLAQYYEKFYAAIASRGFITRAGMYREAAHAVDSFDESAFDRIVLAGFFALTRVEQQLFSSLLRRENVVACF